MWLYSESHALDIKIRIKIFVVAVGTWKSKNKINRNNFRVGNPDREIQPERIRAVNYAFIFLEFVVFKKRYFVCWGEGILFSFKIYFPALKNSIISLVRLMSDSEAGMFSRSNHSAKASSSRSSVMLSSPSTSAKKPIKSVSENDHGWLL